MAIETSKSRERPSAPPPPSAALVLGRPFHRSPLASLRLARRLDTPDAPFIVVRQVDALSPDAELGGLLERERAHGEHLRSPHVVSHYRIPGELAYPCVAMEYVQGLSLEALLAHADGSHHTTRFLLTALLDALDGLADVHEQSAERDQALVHQAPVPRHILVGTDGIARLTDFTQAVSRAHPWTPRLATRLRAHELAPEQLLAPERLDVRCDVFVAAATAFRILTRSSIFPTEQGRAARAVLHMPMPSLADRGAASDPTLDALFSAALRRSPERRTASVRELADGLRAWAAGRALVAPRHALAAWVEALRVAEQHVPEHASFPPPLALRGRAMPTPAPIFVPMMKARGAAELDFAEQLDEPFVEPVRPTRPPAALGHEPVPSGPLPRRRPLSAADAAAVAALFIDASRLAEPDAMVAPAPLRDSVTLAAAPGAPEPVRAARALAQGAALAAGVGLVCAVGLLSASARPSTAEQPPRESAEAELANEPETSAALAAPAQPEGAPGAAAHAPLVPAAPERRPAPARHVVSAGALGPRSAPRPSSAEIAAAPSPTHDAHAERADALQTPHDDAASVPENPY